MQAMFFGLLAALIIFPVHPQESTVEFMEKSKSKTPLVLENAELLCGEYSVLKWDAPLQSVTVCFHRHRTAYQEAPGQQEKLPFGRSYELPGAGNFHSSS